MGAVAVDFKAYAAGIDRLGVVLALLSLAPVISATRFSTSGVPPKPPPPAQGEETQKKGEEKNGKTLDAADKAEATPPAAAAPASIEPALPGIGLASALLLLFAEVLRTWDLFATRSGKKDKLGRLGALLKGVSSGKGRIKPKDSAFENIIAAVATALDAEDAFFAAAGLATLVALTVLNFSMLVRSLPAALFSLRSPQGRQRCALLLACVLPILVFGWLQQATLGKAWKAFLALQFPVMLHLPLRVAALVMAVRPPAPDSEEARIVAERRASQPGAPAAFAALQAGSLVAAASAELMRGKLQGAMTPIVKDPWKLASHLDSPTYTLLAPTLLALIWLFACHLQRHLGALMVASTLCVAMSPTGIVYGWPQLAAARGVDMAQHGPEVLLQVGSMCLALGAGAILLAGGTQSLLGTLIVAQVVVRIHGSEPFAELMG